jgi:hypothetical protein
VIRKAGFREYRGPLEDLPRVAANAYELELVPLPPPKPAGTQTPR